jgi:toxin CcdB
MQFDVFPNPVAASRHTVPYLVVLQSDVVASSVSQVVAPLVRPDAGVRKDSVLTPALSIEGEELRLLIHKLAAVPRLALRGSVANVADHRARIVAALDLLFVGA